MPWNGARVLPLAIVPVSGQPYTVTLVSVPVPLPEPQAPFRLVPVAGCRDVGTSLNVTLPVLVPGTDTSSRGSTLAPCPGKGISSGISSRVRTLV